MTEGQFLTPRCQDESTTATTIDVQEEGLIKHFEHSFCDEFKDSILFMISGKNVHNTIKLGDNDLLRYHQQLFVITVTSL